MVKEMVIVPAHRAVTVCNYYPICASWRTWLDDPTLWIQLGLRSNGSRCIVYHISAGVLSCIIVLLQLYCDDEGHGNTLTVPVASEWYLRIVLLLYVTVTQCVHRGGMKWLPRAQVNVCAKQTLDAEIEALEARRKHLIAAMGPLVRALSDAQSEAMVTGQILRGIKQ